MKWQNEVGNEFIILTVVFLFSIIPSVLFAFCYEDAGQEYNINPALLWAISKTESNLNPTAKNTNSNNTQDIGLMQINSSWVNSLNLDTGLLLSDPCYNLKTGAHILSKCINRYGYEWEAVGCYNAVAKNKQIKYSWKIFEQLMSSEFGVQSSDAGINNYSKPKTTNSEFFFSVREKRND